MNAKKLVYMSLLLGASLIAFAIERRLLIYTGSTNYFKMGFANIFILVAFFTLKPKDTFYIWICKMLVSAAYSFNQLALVISVVGSTASFLTMFITYKCTTKSIYLISSLGAIVNNICRASIVFFFMPFEINRTFIITFVFFSVFFGTSVALASDEILSRLKKYKIDYKA